VNRKKESGSQGVSAQIKARMMAKMESPNNSDRLMLLFPEVWQILAALKAQFERYILSYGSLPRLFPPLSTLDRSQPPQGTTTNGRFLLPFKTGAFLAGVPLQPVIIKYDQDVSRAQGD
jgi:hypothetical protein